MAILFQKPLTKTDISKRLSIPTKYLPYFTVLDQEAYLVPFEVKDHGTGHVHTLYCATRKNGYKKPVFSKGWTTYVRCKKLEVGDMVVFHREEDGAGGFVFKVEAKRRMRLMGHNIWVDV